MFLLSPSIITGPMTVNVFINKCSKTKYNIFKFNTAKALAPFNIKLKKKRKWREALCFIIKTLPKHRSHLDKKFIFHELLQVAENAILSIKNTFLHLTDCINLLVVSFNISIFGVLQMFFVKYFCCLAFLTAFKFFSWLVSLFFSFKFSVPLVWLTLKEVFHVLVGNERVRRCCIFDRRVKRNNFLFILRK